MLDKPNRFRFRAWHIEEGRMCRTAAVHTGEGPEEIRATVILASRGATEYRDCFGENIVLMQSTGLADKNGVEIYEGDVVELKGPHDFSVWQCVRVEWSDVLSCFMYGYHAWTENMAISEARYDFEIGAVVGNIHQNPELLQTEA